MSQVYRYFVVVGAPPKEFKLSGPVLHVEASRIGVGPDAQHSVDFWVEHGDRPDPVARTFQVFGTGHELPPGAKHRGTTARTDDGFVWHLYELAGGS